jgi:hypothetical protein
MDNVSTDAEEIRKRVGELWRLAYYGINSFAVGYMVAVDARALVGLMKLGSDGWFSVQGAVAISMYTATTLVAVMMFYSSSVGTTINRGRPTLAEVWIPLTMGIFLAAQAICLDPASPSPYLWSFFLAGSHAGGLLVQSLIVRRLVASNHWHPELREIGESYTSGLLKSARGTFLGFLISLTLATLYSIYRSDTFLLLQALASIGFLLYALFELEKRWKGYMNKISEIIARPPVESVAVVAATG